MALDPLMVLADAVQSVESGGRRYDASGRVLTSPKGAMGEMQVMPGTQADPGFGVKPARPGDLADVARVGRDYLGAMVRRYGDLDAALAAYNWGPGNADKWLAAGADPAALPKETRDYLQRVKSRLPQDFSLVARAAETAPEPGSEPPPVEQQVAAVSSAPAPAPKTVSATQPYGAGYQAALAVSFLADSKAEDKEDDGEPSEAERVVAASAAAPQGMTARSALADLDLQYSSPFPVQQPLRMADGGFAVRPFATLTPSKKAAIKSAREDLQRYSDEANAYNAAAEQYNADVYAPYQSQVGAFNAAVSEYETGVYNPYVAQVDAYNAALNKYLTDVYNPYQTQISAYNAAVEAWNAGPRTTEFSMAVPTTPAEFSLTAPTAPAAFSLTPPTAPDPFSMAQPAAPKVSPEEYQAMQARARKEMAANALAFEVLADPGKYNLALPKLFAEGGEARTEDQPPDQAAFGVYPSSGIGRPQSEYSQMMQSGEGARQFVRGAALAPQYLLGAPVDIATMAMRPFGYDVKEPVGGSEWLIRKSRELGIAPKAPESAPEKMAFGAGELAGQVVSPVSMAESAVRGVGRVAERAGEAARMLAEATPGAPRPLSGGYGASQRGAVTVGGKKEPIYVEMPTPEAPFVSKLEGFVAEMPGAVRKEQFLNSLKGKFKAHEVQRAEEVLSDLPADAKLSQSELLNRIKSRYSPDNFAIEIRDPIKPGAFESEVENRFENYDNVYKKKPLGVINLYEREKRKPVDYDEKILLSHSDRLRNALYSAGGATGSHVDEAFSVINNPYSLQVIEKYDPDQANMLKYVQRQMKRYIDNTVLKDAIGGGTIRRAMSADQDNALYYGKFISLPKSEKEDILNAYYKKNGLERDPEDWRNYRNDSFAENEYNLEQVNKIITDLEAKWPMVKEVGYRVEIAPVYYEGSSTPFPRVDLSGGPSNIQGKSKREVFVDLLDQSEQSMRESFRASAKVLSDVASAAYWERKKADLRGSTKYTSQHPELTPDGHIAFSRFSEHTTNIPGYGKVNGIYVNELQSDRLDDLRKRENKATEPFKGMKDQPQTTQQLMIKSVIAAAAQRGDRFVAFPGAESDQAQLYEKLPRNLNEVIKDLGPGFEVRPIELTDATGTVRQHPGVVISPEGAARLLKQGVPFAEGGEVKKGKKARKSKPAQKDDMLSRRSLDEYLQQEGWRNLRPFDADSMAYIQELAQRNPAYAEMLQYLDARGARPEMRMDPMQMDAERGIRPGMLGYFEAPSKTGREPGSIGISRDEYENQDPRRGVPALAHEMTHAADRQMRTQMGESAPKSEARRMFEEAYAKMGRRPMAERLGPDWAKQGRGYRASEAELPAFAMGNVSAYQDGVSADSEPVRPPLHLDPTMATEFLILQDLARRAQAAQAQPAP